MTDVMAEGTWRDHPPEKPSNGNGALVPTKPRSATGHNIPYDDAVVQQAFLIWTFEAHRSYAVTARRLATSIRAEAALRGEDDPLVPDERTVRHWAVTCDWAGQAQHMLTQDDQLKSIFFQQKAQAVLLYGEVLTKMSEAVADMEPSAKNLGALAKVAEHLAKTGGHAILATVVQAPELPPPMTQQGAPIDLAALPPDERARMRQKIAAQQMDRTRRLKNPRKGKI